MNRDEGEMSEEVSEDRIVDWLEGRLSEPEARKVSRRVEADEGLRDRARWLRVFLAAGERIELSAPPGEVRRELRRRFAALSEGRRRTDLLERMVAVLRFDGGFQAAPAGARSAAAREGHRQLVFTTDVVEIALSVLQRRGGRALDLSGQVFPIGGEEASPDFTVQLLDGTREVGITSTDEVGEFTIERVRPGTYSMFLTAARVEVLISPLELRGEQ